MHAVSTAALVCAASVKNYAGTLGVRRRDPAETSGRTLQQRGCPRRFTRTDGRSREVRASALRRFGSMNDCPELATAASVSLLAAGHTAKARCRPVASGDQRRRSGKPVTNIESRPLAVCTDWLKVFPPLTPANANRRYCGTATPTGCCDRPYAKDASLVLTTMPPSKRLGIHSATGCGSNEASGRQSKLSMFPSTMHFIVEFTFQVSSKGR